MDGSHAIRVSQGLSPLAMLELHSTQYMKNSTQHDVLFPFFFPSRLLQEHQQLKYQYCLEQVDLVSHNYLQRAHHGYRS